MSSKNFVQLRLPTHVFRSFEPVVKARNIRTHFVSIACLCPRHGPFISPPQCCETAHYRHEYTGPPMTCLCCRTRISRTLSSRRRIVRTMHLLFQQGLIPIPVELFVADRNPGGIVKRSLAMVFSGPGQTMANTCSFDDATRLTLSLHLFWALCDCPGCAGRILFRRIRQHAVSLLPGGRSCEAVGPAASTSLCCRCRTGAGSRGGRPDRR